MPVLPLRPRLPLGLGRSSVKASVLSTPEAWGQAGHRRWRPRPAPVLAAADGQQGDAPEGPRQPSRLGATIR